MNDPPLLCYRPVIPSDGNAVPGTPGRCRPSLGFRIPTTLDPAALSAVHSFHCSPSTILDRNTVSFRILQRNTSPENSKQMELSLVPGQVIYSQFLVFQATGSRAKFESRGDHQHKNRSVRSAHSHINPTPAPQGKFCVDTDLP